MSKSLNQPDPEAPIFFSITVDKYADAIWKDYRHDRLFSKALSVVDSSSIYYLHPINGFLYQNSPSGTARLCVPDIKVPTHGGKLERIRNVLTDMYSKHLVTSAPRKHFLPWAATSIGRPLFRCYPSYSTMSRLASLQGRIMRAITGCFRTTAIAALEHETALPPP
jgi:hypothetical protein